MVRINYCYLSGIIVNFLLALFIAIFGLVPEINSYENGTCLVMDTFISPGTCENSDTGIFNCYGLICNISINISINIKHVSYSRLAVYGVYENENDAKKEIKYISIGTKVPCYYNKNNISSTLIIHKSTRLLIFYSINFFFFCIIFLIFLCSFVMDIRKNKAYLDTELLPLFNK